MIVFVQAILAVVGDVQIRPAIIVEVTHGTAVSPAAVRHSGFFRHVRKRAVVIVSKERRMWRFSFAGEGLVG